MNQIITNTQYLREIVEYLTKINPARRFGNTHSLNQSAEFIQKEFEKHSLETHLQTFTLTPEDDPELLEGPKEAWSEKYHNVIAKYNPGKKKTLVIGAHYDVCGDQPGADDNASAVAGLLELARLTSKYQPKINYTIEFVAYNLEEPPHFGTKNMGSFVHAKSLKEKKVIGMICLEMLGYFTDEPNSQDYPLEQLEYVYPKAGNFIAIVGNLKSWNLMRKLRNGMKKSDMPTAVLPIPLSLDYSELGVGLSDHSNYWQHGFNAIMITDTAFLRNKNYHKTSDKIETLDFDRMGKVVNGVFLSL